MRRWLLLVAAVLVIAAAPRDKQSGRQLLGPELGAMQADDTLNPGMLWVLDGEALWRQPAGPEGRACADCHGEAATTMRGVAARHPAFDPARQGPITLESRIQACRRDHQAAPPPALESDELLALSAYVAHQSRGMPVSAGGDPRLRPFIEAGRGLFERRHGQLDLACAQCHDERAGQRLGGSLIPQGHPNGYPLYRLEWQALGSLQRRLRNCMIGVRAEPFAAGSPEAVALELYLMTRANGLPIETPAVRP